MNGTTRGTLKSLGYRDGDVARLAINATGHIARSAQPTGVEVVDVTINVEPGSWITFHRDGRKIDGLGAATKVWGIPAPAAQPKKEDTTVKKNPTPKKHWQARSRSRQTGTVIVTGHHEDMGIAREAGDGPWVTLCEAHGSFCAHDTLAIAESWAPIPLEWCAGCQAGEPALDDEVAESTSTAHPKHAEIVEAVRTDAAMGRGSCSVIDECYTDDELVAKFGWERDEMTDEVVKARPVRASVAAAKKAHRVWASTMSAGW